MSISLSYGESTDEDDEDDVLQNRESNHADVIVRYDECLGKGAHGIVYKALYRGREVAVKELTSARSAKKLINEITIMQAFLDAPQILSLLGHCPTSHRLILPLKKNGDLRKYLRKNGSPLTFFRKVKLAIDICTGLSLLHQSGYVHGDISSSNILIDTDASACLCDFGLSRKSENMVLFGNLYYAAPEHYQRLPYTKASDVFSLGLVLHEVFFSPSPHVGAQRSKFIREKEEISHAYPSHPRRIVDLFMFNGDEHGLKMLITCCLDMDATCRPTIDQVLSVLQNENRMMRGIV